jgi:hypothetical protein
MVHLTEPGYCEHDLNNVIAAFTRQHPDAVIRSLAELPAMLDRWESRVLVSGRRR